MKKRMLVYLCLFCYSCEQHYGKNISTEQQTRKYIVKTSLEKLNTATKKYYVDNLIDTMQAYNDTVAYMTALTMIYNYSITERENNRGEPRSFLIFDEKGINLDNKLSAKIINSLKMETRRFPDVKRLIDAAYARDSLLNNKTK